MEHLKRFILRECTDRDEIYGYITCNDFVDVSDIQSKINEIKNGFYDDNNDDWEIYHVLNKMPREWDVKWYMLEDEDLYI